MEILEQNFRETVEPVLIVLSSVFLLSHSHLRVTLSLFYDV